MPCLFRGFLRAVMWVCNSTARASLQQIHSKSNSNGAWTKTITRSNQSYVIKFKEITANEPKKNLSSKGSGYDWLMLQLSNALYHHDHRVACPWMNVAVSTNDFPADGSLMANTSAEMSPVVGRKPGNSLQPLGRPNTPSRQTYLATAHSLCWSPRTIETEADNAYRRHTQRSWHNPAVILTFDLWTSANASRAPAMKYCSISHSRRFLIPYILWCW